MMTGLRNAKIWTAALVVTAVAAAPSAQQSAAPAVNAPIATAAAPQGGPSAPAQAPQPIDRYVVGQAKPPEQPGSPMLDLTLEKAIQIALDNNLDLQSARINPILQDFSLRANRAVFLPTVTGQFTNSHSQQPPSSNLTEAGLSTSISTVQGYTAQLSQNMLWYGGNMTLRFTSGRNASNNPFATNNPALSAGFSANYTQPLLSGFKIDNNRNTLRTATIQRQIQDVNLQSTIENTKANVRTAYWNLRRMIESIEIQKRSLDLAQRQLTETRQKVDIGTVAPIETTNFEVQVANGQQGLLSAEINWKTQELAFKRLLVASANDPLYNSTINPVDQPLLVQSPVDIPGAVQTALAQRTDIEAGRKGLQVTQMNLDVTKNNTMPNLSVNGGYSLAGQGGPTFSQGITTPGGYWDALTTLSQRPSWNVGLNFTYPLGMVSAKAQLARAELQLEQSKVTQKSLELTVTSDVTQAGLNVNNAYRQYEAAKTSREAQEKNADAAQTRFSAGLATPFEVATALQSLTTARLSELNAIINYLNAVADFDKKQRVGG